MALAMESYDYGNARSVIGVDRDTSKCWGVVSKFDNIEIITGDSTDAETYNRVKGFIGEMKIGLLFLDSTHDGDTPRKEFELYRPLLDSPCIVAVDDLLGPRHLEEKMMAFWNWLPGEKILLHDLHPVPDTHYGLIDQPGFGVAIV